MKFALSLMLCLGSTLLARGKAVHHSSCPSIEDLTHDILSADGQIYAEADLMTFDSGQANAAILTVSADFVEEMVLLSTCVDVPVIPPLYCVYQTPGYLGDYLKEAVADINRAAGNLLWLSKTIQPAGVIQQAKKALAKQIATARSQMELCHY